MTLKRGWYEPRLCTAAGRWRTEQAWTKAAEVTLNAGVQNSGGWTHKGDYLSRVNGVFDLVGLERNRTACLADSLVEVVLMMVPNQ